MMALNDFSDLLHAMLVLPLLVGSFAGGLLVQYRLPETRRGPKTHEMLRVVMEMLVTFAAIVLGLLITTAKADFDAVGGEVGQFAIDIIALDQTLAGYGRETDPLRTTLRRYTRGVLVEAGPPGSDTVVTARDGLLGTIERGALTLTPATALQAHLQDVMLSQLGGLRQQRHRMDEQARAPPSLVFYAMLSIWLMVVYGCFGLISEHTWLGSTVVGMSIMAVVLALFVTFEMNSPFNGLIVVSDRPLADAFHTIASE